jgi:hypothetical protein
MELTATQKLSLQLAVSSRIIQLEGFSDTSYAVRELDICQELRRILDQALTVNIKPYSTV